MTQYWKRICLAAIVAHLLQALYVYEVAPSPHVAGEPLGLAMMFGFFAAGGLWCTKGMSDTNPLLAGMLVGCVGAVLATLLQFPIMPPGEEALHVPAVIDHGLKIAGGAFGALAALFLGWRRRHQS